MGGRVMAAAVVTILILSGCATMSGRGSGPKLSVTFNDTSWDGVRVPDGMQCAKQGGVDPWSPPILVSWIPKDTARLIVEFNDESYPPLAKDGGHGKFAVDVAGRDEVIIPPFTEGQTSGFLTGVTLVANNRSGTGAGYLAPCSDKKDHVYSVTVRAMSATNQELGRGYALLGKY